MARLPTLELPQPKVPYPLSHHPPRRPLLTSILAPQTFFHYMSLRTGTELIALSMIVNKISGFYGILALFTGKPLNSLQLSMYLYSIMALGLIVYLTPHIRKQSPLQCLALAWFYLIDSLINAAYTAAFGVAWFLVLALHPQENKLHVPGGSTIHKTSGFTNPKYNVSHVDVVATPAEGLKAGQDAVAVGNAGSAPAGLGNAVFQSGSIASITIISALWALRVYFILVVMAYARQVLRQHIVTTSTINYQWQQSTSGQVLAENPFAEGRTEGQGWQGKLGRSMIGVWKSYWLGGDDDGEWMRGMGTKFQKLTDPAGVYERERRRRSGTGPPPPPPMPRFQSNIGPQ